ncbi:MAG: S8 family peptidase [Saprospiraceae bacterium]
MYTLKNNIRFLITCLLLLSIGATTYSQSSEKRSDELIIKWKSSSEKKATSRYNSLITQKGRKLKTINGTNIEIWKIPLAKEKDIITLIEHYKNHPDIAFIEPNYIYRSFEVIPNDPLFNEQWGLKNTRQTGNTITADISAPDAWEIQERSTSVKVAIIDSGTDWTHPDLVQNIWQNLGEDIDGDGTVLQWTGSQWIFDPDDENGIDDDGNGYVDDFIGWDFRDNDNNPMDFDGHGTHVAGIVGASGNNGLGISGVTWEVQLVSLRIISNGRLKVSDAIEAIQYATLMNIPISNNSWGGKDFSGLLFNTIKEAATNNHLFITAAGNDGLDTDVQPIYPASFDLNNILNVAASDTLDTSATFKVGSSNFGQNTVDIYAPGLNILSCLPNNTYGTRNGTILILLELIFIR